MRLPGEALIDRTRPLAFTFNGRRFTGCAGDTLASALLANGVRLVGRSFKLHRPRGIFSAGPEEPNALITVGDGTYREVNVRATEIPLYNGLIAWSQNCWPTVGFDMAGAIGLFARLLPAGFYHKTFKWPRWGWYEGLVRNIAGLGRLNGTSDPDRYATRFYHCDVLIVGAGPAGLAAARAAAAQNQDVVLIDSGNTLGGSLLAERVDVEGVSAQRWAAERQRELSAMPRVLLLPRTMALGYYDANLVTAVERINDVRGPLPESAGPRQRLWKIRAGRVVLATGAIERPLIFQNNDRPGVMLASAVRTYVRRYAVGPGSRAVVYTNNDSAYETAFALHDAGIKIAAIVDVRKDPGAEVVQRAQSLRLALHRGSAVVDTKGRKAVRLVEIARCDADYTQLMPGTLQTLKCDLLCTSGGWDPVVHLYSQAGGKLRYDAATASFVPGDDGHQVECVGAANGHFDLTNCLENGHRAGTSAGNQSGVAATSNESPIQPMWRVPTWGRRDRRHRQWVDLAHDVTVCDIDLAATEGFRSVEHMKRYTSAGMAFDQGKTSNVNALALLGQATGRAAADVGTTTFRPPFHSVAIGALAGARAGELAQRYRRLPVHWHEVSGAVMEDHSGWLRPAYYLRNGETEVEAIDREVRMARSAVALFDSSSLGKIEVCGADAAEFLNRLYVNDVKTLKPGRLRYGLMLNDNGIIIDDGVLACLGEGRYLVNTSSAGALDIHFWMEEWLQCEWRSLRVWIAQQTAQWATLTLSGPKARAVLAQLKLPVDLGTQAFPHMRICETEFEGTALRVRRASFTGELSFELDVAADLGDALWRRLLDLGAAHAITPIGMQALDVLRVEKGFLEVGADTDGDTSPLDVGWGRAIDKKPEDFIGRRSLKRAAMQSPARLQLVGLLPTDPRLEIPVGTHALDSKGSVDGHVTSSCMSPHLERSVAIGRVRAGTTRKGQNVILDIGGRRHPAAIVDTGFYDPKGERLNV
jgi:sarcosine oxidase, subunit alpha